MANPEPQTGLSQPMMACQECGAELSADSPALRVELAYDDEWVVYCQECWQRELGESAEASIGEPGRAANPMP
jgi:hypothetical protein